MEKKKVVGVILALMLVPNIVYGADKADEVEQSLLYSSGGDDTFTRGYKDFYLKVKNKDGAKIYLENNKDGFKYDLTKEVLPYGTVVEYTYDACKHGSCKRHNSNLKEDDYYILVTESKENPEALGGIVDIKDFEIEKTNYNKNPKLLKSGLYTVKDVEVRSGPGVIYDVVGTIKKDTNLLVDEKLTDFYHSYAEVASTTGDWIMVSDGKVKGYVDFPLDWFRNDEIAYKFDSKKDYYYGHFYDNMWIEKNEDIPFGIKLDIKYKYRDLIYINYKNQTRKISFNNLIEKSDLKLYFPKNYIQNDDIDKYSDYKETLIDIKTKKEQNDKIDMFKKDKLYDIEYINGDETFDGVYIKKDNDMYLLEINKIGFYDSDKILKRNVPIVTDQYKEYTFDEDTRLYKIKEEGQFDDKNIIKTLKKGEKIKAYKIYNFFTTLGESNSINNMYLYNEELGYFVIKSNDKFEEQNSEDINKNEEYKPIEVKKDVTNMVLGFTGILILIATLAIKILTIYYK